MMAEREWRDIATDQGARLLRLRLALQILRSWSNGGASGSAPVARVIHGWIDAGMEGPLPWPDDPGFHAWAAREGLGRVGDHIGHWFSAAPATRSVH